MASPLATLAIIIMAAISVGIMAVDIITTADTTIMADITTTVDTITTSETASPGRKVGVRQFS